ncbi:GAF domain-containing protein [Nocardioides panaciterrulae]|uniref:PAS domain S-box-containing protein n=1 Tax=Nocardioides panaciterrulae TaxID=661492 RepID=A0A7Y9EAE0_9ACTN|nr:GAF domain-containing protein [Nocardioides panaciterrulae]NYD43790.1 PAS domain S-box-containing protein [Nocardioides panaciterrulae]
MSAALPRQVPPEAMRALLDGAPDAVLGVDEAGLVDYANASALRLLGRRADELVGLPLDTLLADEAGVPLGTAGLEAATTAGRPGSPAGTAAATLRRGAEVVHVEVRLTLLATTTGPWWLVSATDVTERVRGEQRVRAANRAYLALARVNEAIIRAPDVADLFPEVCRTAVEESGFLGAWIACRGKGWTVRTLARAGAIDEYVEGLQVTTDPDQPTGQGPTALALREGVTSFHDDYLHDPQLAPWHRHAARFGVRGLATLPLRRDGRTMAAFTLWSAHPQVFDDRMRALLVQVADNVSYALEVLDARTRLVRSALQRSQLLQRLVVAQEEERARIAADVHDDSVQSLAAMDLRLGLLLRRVRQDAPDLEPTVTQLQALNASVTAGLRHLLFDLEPVPPGSDLAELLRDAAAHALDGTATRFSVEVADGAADGDGAGDGDGDGDGAGAGAAGLGDEVVTTALRIAQEALANVRKHARAGEVRVVLCAGPRGVEVAISDDGVGLPEVERPSPGHRGVRTMRDRAAVGGGWLRLEAGSPGTTVRYWLPRRTTWAVVS